MSSNHALPSPMTAPVATAVSSRASAIHTVTTSLLGLSEHGGLFAYYTSGQYRDFVLGGRFWLALAILTLTSFLINFFRQLNRMLGPGTLVSLLLGRYHRPVAEERIFMFLDLNNSTAIAAALGPLRFNDFKNDFFHDSRSPCSRRVVKSTSTSGTRPW